MAMNFTESNASIFNNAWFRDRVRGALSTWVAYLMNTAPTDADYAIKTQAAKTMTSQNEMIVQQLMFSLSGDNEVKTAGPAIPDAQLQSIVEKTVKLWYPIEAPPAGMGYAPTPGAYMPPMMPPRQ